MAYFDNADFHPTLADEEFDIYSFLNQPPAIEQSSQQPYPAFANHWGTAGAPISLEATAGYESVASATSHAPQLDNNTQPSYMNEFWPGFQDQPQFVDPLGWMNTHTNTTKSEASTIVQASSRIPLDYWGHSQSEQFTSAFYPEPDPVGTSLQQHAYASDQHSAGPTRTEVVPTERFQPYGTAGAHTTGYKSAEEEPTTTEPPSIPRVASPTQQPSGGMSETTAVAEKQHNNIEEDKIPMSTRARHPSCHGKPRNYRTQVREETPILFEWVRKQPGHREPKSFCEALGVAVEAIKVIRPLQRDEPFLTKILTKSEEAGSHTARREQNSRVIERQLYEELSRRYPAGGLRWTRGRLLSQVMSDLASHPALQ